MKFMSKKWIFALTMGAALFCSAAEQQLFPKLNVWYTWKNKGMLGKIAKKAPSQQLPQGEIAFLPESGSGQYNCCAYGNEKISLDRAYRLTITLRISPDVNPDATATLSLSAKKAGHAWYSAVWGKTVKPSPKAEFTIQPGTDQSASVEVDLAKYPQLTEMVYLCPFVSVKNLKSGSIRVVRFELSSKPGVKPATPKKN